MRVRNAVMRPPFIMYYLTFLLPRAADLLRAADLDVVVHEGTFTAPFDRCRIVEARRAS